MQQENGLERKTLREWRKDAGFTQVELEELSGTRSDSISEMEIGLRDIKGREGRRVLQALGVTYAQVVQVDPAVNIDISGWEETGKDRGAPVKDLRWWREYRGLSQRELAALSGITVAALIRIEQGINSSTKPYARRALQSALCVAPDKLILPGDDKKESVDTPLTDILRADLRGSRRALKKCYDFLSQDPNIAFRSQDARDALLRDIGPELKGL